MYLEMVLKQGVQEGIPTIRELLNKVTLSGDYEDSIEDISNYILAKTGLSIFYSKKVHKILKNYSIIINFKSEEHIDINQLRKKAIVFDFSIEKAFKQSNNRRERRAVIQDFLFKASDLNIKQNKWMEGLAPSYVYESFHPLKTIKPEALVVNKGLYSFKDFVDYQLDKKTVST